MKEERKEGKERIGEKRTRAVFFSTKTNSETRTTCNKRTLNKNADDLFTAHSRNQHLRLSCIIPTAYTGSKRIGSISVYFSSNHINAC